MSCFLIDVHPPVSYDKTLWNTTVTLTALIDRGDPKICDLDTKDVKKCEANQKQNCQQAGTTKSNQKL